MSKRWAVGAIWAIAISGNPLMFGWSAAAQVLPTPPSTNRIGGELLAKPGKLLISAVIITGNHRMRKSEIKALLRTQPGTEYNPAVVDEDVRALYKTNQFSDINTSLQRDGNDKAKIFFSVCETPNTVQKVTFLGVRHIKKDELQNITGVRPGMPLNPNLNRNGCRKILAEYEAMGRLLADCQLLKGGDLADTEVVYQITEGPKVKICDIKFIGNTFVSGARLLTEIASSRKSCTFISNWTADNWIAHLYKFYRSFGFQDVRISSETQRSPDRSGVTLIFHIQEGPRYRVRETPEVHCDPELSGEQLAALSQIKPGDYLDEVQMKADIKKISDYIGKHNGYNAHIEAIPIYISDSPGKCNLRYEVILTSKD